MILWIPIRIGHELSEGGNENVLSPYRLNLIRSGISCYRFANIELKIQLVDDFCELGVVGVLMRGIGLCCGYLNDIEKTNELFTY